MFSSSSTRKSVEARQGERSCLGEVHAEHIDPSRFERAYFLAPAGGSVKAYQLLAETMEKSDRAGIATFVMRDKAYLVAILAENGILRAETLRLATHSRRPPGRPADVVSRQNRFFDAAFVRKEGRRIRFERPHDGTDSCCRRCRLEKQPIARRVAA